MASGEVETDEELRELVAETLETKGVLGNIRAELRAHVFLALEEDKLKGRQIHMHPRIHSFLRTLDGKLAAAIVREFLEFYDLHHTASVFEPEAGAYELSGRDEILEKLKLTDVPSNEPVLCSLIHRLPNEQPATISSSKLATLLSGAGGQVGGGLGELPVTSSTFGQVLGPAGRETTSAGMTNRIHGSVEGFSSVGLNPEVWKNPNPNPLLQTSLSGEKLSLGGDSFQSTDSKAFDSSLEIKQLVEGTHQVDLSSKDRQAMEDMFSNGHTHKQANLQRPPPESTSSFLSLQDLPPISTVAGTSGFTGQLNVEEEVPTESIQTVSESKTAGSQRHPSRQLDSETLIDETLTHSDASLRDADYLETIKKT